MAEKIKSTKSQLVEFKESFIWSDIKDELNKLSARSLGEYDTVGEVRMDGETKIYPSTSETLIHLGYIKGQRAAINYFLDVIDILILDAEQQQEEAKADRSKNNQSMEVS